MGKLKEQPADEVAPDDADEAEAKQRRKAAKRAAKEAAAEERGPLLAAVEEEEVDEAEAKRRRKEAKRAAKEAAAAAEAAAAEEEEVEAKRQRKAAKKAAKEAAEKAVAEEEPEKKGKRATEATAASEPVAKKPKQTETTGDDIADGDFEVFVGGIAFDCDEKELRSHFERCGGIEKFSMPVDDEWKAKGIAFITFSRKPGVVAALKLDKSKFMNRTLKVRLSSAKEELPAKGTGKGGKDDAGAEGLEVFVGGIPWNVDEATFRKDFEDCGEVENIHMPMADGKPKGIAFIKYKTSEGVAAAMKFNGTTYGGRPLQIRLSSVKSTKGQGKGAFVERKDELTAFVTGLAFTTTQDSMRAKFGECGKIDRLMLPSDEFGVSKGVAFVQYSDKDSVAKAIKFTDTNFEGRWIKVRAYDGPGQGAVRTGKGGSGAQDEDGEEGAGGKAKGGKGKGAKGKSSDKGKKGSKSGQTDGPAEWTKAPKHTGGIVESTGKKQVFADSDED